MLKITNIIKTDSGLCFFLQCKIYIVISKIIESVDVGLEDDNI